MKRNAAKICESAEHGMEPEMHIQSTNITENTDHNEVTRIHSNHCEDNEGLKEFGRPELSPFQARNKTSPNTLNLNILRKTRTLYKTPRKES